MEWLSRTEKLFAKPWVRDEACTNAWNSLNGDLERARRSFFDDADDSDAQIASVAKRGFALRQKIAELLPANASDACLEGARRFLYLQRVNEGVLFAQRLDPNASFPKARDLRGGDLLLLRGSTFFDAFYGQVGDAGSSFSRMAVVFKNPQGRIFLIESHPSFGGLAAKTYEEVLQRHRDEPFTRIAVLRPRDRKLAERAARSLFTRLQDDSARGGRPTFSETPEPIDPSKLFMTDPARWAWTSATAGSHPFAFPRRSSLKRLRSNPFGREMGWTSETALLPVDFEIDPRFQIIAEFHHGPALLAARRWDAVVRSVFNWMANDGSAFRADLFGGDAIPLVYGPHELGWMRQGWDPQTPRAFADCLTALFNLVTTIRIQLDSTPARTLREMDAAIAEIRRRDCFEQKIAIEGRRDDRIVLFHQDFRGPHGCQ